MEILVDSIFGVLLGDFDRLLCFSGHWMSEKEEEKIYKSLIFQNDSKFEN